MKTIAFVVYPGMTALDLVGPLQVLAQLPSFAPEYEVVTVAQKKEPAGTDALVSVLAEKEFDEVPSPWAVVVPGGLEATLNGMADERLLDYLRSRTGLATSVCTGSLLLGAAGLLKGRRATTHWTFRDFLPRFGATPVTERWVEDGPVITAAGVSAGIDMALHLVERLSGAEAAHLIQLGIEYDPQPPHGPIDWESVDLATWKPWAEEKIHNVLAEHPELAAVLGQD